MRKFLIKISSLVTAVLILCAALVGCVSPDEKQPKLSTPEVTISANGIAVWGKVDYVLYYVYVIDDGEEEVTGECSVQLSENQTIKVKAVSSDNKYADSDFSEPQTYIKREIQGGKLSKPEVVIGFDGVAVWGKIDNALRYIYVIDGGEEKETNECRVQLLPNQTIKVKAVSGNNKYTDSDFSEPKTYIKSDVGGHKLATPEVVIGSDGVAVWGKVEYALHYIYVIDDGGELMTVECSVQLSENQTIKVKAVSGDEQYADSDFSKPQTYTKKNDGVGDHTHTDRNSDGLCDICDESVTAELSFYAVNDLHGKFKDTDNQPGLDEFTTYLKDLYADTSREEILLSSGDMWQGTVESSTNRGQLMTEWMNEVGFVSMTLGNHEYDWGADVLTPNSKLAEFPFLAINVTYQGKPVEYCKASTVVERAGIKIGIIGAIGDCLSSISGDFTPGLSFATGSKLTSLVMAESDRLRKEEGCDFIVYSIHEGGDSFSSSGINSVTNKDMSWYDTALSDGYVDLVFEGHSHQRYILRDEYGVYHMQGGGENSYISCAEVSFNTITNEFAVNPKLIGNSVYANSRIEGDPFIEELYNKYFPDSDPYTTVLGTNNSRKQSDEICAKVAELYYRKGIQEWGNEYDIVLGGGFLKLRNPYQIAAGKVTYADLFSILPFDNDIVLGKIKGSDLKSKFINSTNSAYHCYSTINSNSISNNQYYYIIVDSYTSTYKYNNITEVARLGGRIYARDLLAEFVSAGGWGSPKPNTYTINGTFFNVPICAFTHLKGRAAL